MILEMLADASLISVIDCSISFMWVLPVAALSLACRANWLAWLALTAFSLICAAICVIDEVSASTEVACSVAPRDSA